MFESADQLERRYGDNSSDVTPLETDQKDVEQKTFEIGQLSKDDESNSIPFGLSEREFQKYNKLLSKLRFKNFVINGPSAASTPTTEESTTEETTPTIFLFNQQPRQEEIYPEDITDVDEDYDIIIMDQTQHILPILAPSGFGFFQAFVNLVRWLITASANVDDNVEE